MERRQVPAHRGNRGTRELEESAIDWLLQQRVEGLVYASGSHQEVVLPPAMHELPTVLVHCFDREDAGQRSFRTKSSAAIARPDDSLRPVTAASDWSIWNGKDGREGPPSGIH